MTPWRSVKAASADGGNMKVNELKTESTDVARIAFAAAQFTDEAAVKSWLDAGGYADYAVAKTETGFEVVNAEVEFDGEPEPVQLAEGLTAYVGRLKAVEATQESDPVAGSVTEAAESEKAAGEAPAASEAPAGKTEVAAEAAPSEDATDAPAAKADEPVCARKSLYTVTSLGRIISDLVYLTEDRAWDAKYRDADAAVVEGLRTHATALVEILRALTADALAHFANWVDAATAGSVAEATAAKAEPEAEAPAAKADAAPAVDPRVDALVEMVGKLAATVEGLTKSIADEKAEAAQKAAEVASAPVAARRSADVDEATPPIAKAAEPDSRGFNRALSGVLGF
ncbi:hypothetical protein [Azospirillum argentinense]|uniref:hypothetical protein n=1 Tax=Azospirillum argentinense TaxID=2970906 RepID=UPI0032E04064